MARISRKTLAIGLGVTVLLAGIGAFAFFGRGTEPPVVVTAVAQEATLRQTVEASGVLEAIEDVELSFEAGGTVSEVPAPVGTDVVEGDLLIALAAEELEAGVSQASQSVSFARARVAEKIAGATNEASAVASAALASVEASRAGAQEALASAREQLARTRLAEDASVARADASVRTAQDGLARTTSENAQSLASAEEDRVTAARDAMISVRSGLSQADEVLGIDNSIANDDFESILSALDDQAIISAKSAYRAAKEHMRRAEDLVFALDSGAARAQVDAAMPAVEDALEGAMRTLLETRRVLDATSVDTADFTFSDLSALKAAVDAERGSVQLSQSSLRTQEQGAATARLTAITNELAARNALREAEQAAVVAQTARDSRVFGAESEVRSAESSLAVAGANVAEAKARLDEVRARPRAVDVAALEAELRRAEAELRAAEARLAKTQLRAPISGRVTMLAFAKGEQAAPGVPAVRVQALDERFRVVVDVSESDIAKVSLDDGVSVSFDAFGEDLVVPGTVKEIDPAEKTIEGVTYYEVTVYLDPAQLPVGLKPGMSADAEILTAVSENAVVVPARAVLERADGTKYVRVGDAVPFEERAVRLGLRGDGGLVEILDGVRAGERVILSVREAL